MKTHILDSFAKTHAFRLLIVITLALALISCDNSGQSSSGDEPILIKFPHVTAPGTPKGQTADRFEQLVEERLAGRVEVEVYPSGQLMSDDDSIDALAFGEVQMIAVSISKLDRLTKRFQVFDLPFLFPDLEAVEAFQNGAARPVLLDSITDRGIKGLGFWHNGMKQFGAPVAMNRPEAAAGLKFRIMESDVLQEQILALGGNPQKMAFGEVYQALQTGAVDAQENTWSNMYSSKFFEVQPYLTETNHGYLGYLFAVNTAFWEGLPEDIRAELQVIVDEVSAWGNERAEAINQESRQKIVEANSSTVVTLTDVEHAVWAEKMRGVWDMFADSIGQDVIAAAVSSSVQ